VYISKNETETEMQKYAVKADGTYWMDPDGHMSWEADDANALADHLESMGYDVIVDPV
jgi:hypothetical protein